MEIRQVSESIHIYSDGQRLQVIHNLGDEFILDLTLGKDYAWNIDRQVQETIKIIKPVFKVSGFCSRSGEDMHRLRWAILQFQEFEQYVNDYQADLLDWWDNPGGEDGNK
ncbi:hypothetical protein KUF97_09710 [Streptococcus equi subsp. zooepidemicus]|uniref:hypothetical protein n=1 Tax=Streptococcus equi TaxID=1336 RepID=UPI001E444025|nr:hypothetical protein [Streptococcus equi]MCD3414380.1 hypothetical protein [Streptococcus equi subsp. zooepidemicus]HEL0787329.1 hypothetical protein [Streptococcus equi subsp. zooepidemicus]